MDHDLIMRTAEQIEAVINLKAAAFTEEELTTVFRNLDRLTAAVGRRVPVPSEDEDDDTPLDQLAKKRRVQPPRIVNLFVDGAAKNGYFSWSVVMNNECCSAGGGPVPFTHNEVEYAAVCKGVSYAEQKGFKRVVINTDSEMAAKAMNGKIHVHSPTLQPFVNEVNLLRKYFHVLRFRHITSDMNKTAVREAKIALDGPKP